MTCEIRGDRRAFEQYFLREGRTAVDARRPRVSLDARRHLVSERLRIAAAAHGERQRHEVVARDRGADVRGLALNQVQRAGDGDRLGDLTHLQLGVQTQCLCNLHCQFVANERLESLDFELRRVAANGQAWHGVLPGPVGECRVGEAALVSDGDRDAGNRRAQGVGHSPRNRGPVDLRIRDRGYGETGDDKHGESMHSHRSPPKSKLAEPISVAILSPADRGVNKKPGERRTNRSVGSWR